MFKFINHVYQFKNIILFVFVLMLIKGLTYKHFVYKIENFNSNSNKNESKTFKWTNQLLFDFLTIQKLINPGIIFDTNIIKEQVTEDEMKFFLKNKYFYWSEDTKQKYLYFINHNPIIRITANSALNNAQTIYNETAILQFLYIRSNEIKT